MLKDGTLGAGHWTSGGIVVSNKIGLVHLTKVDNVNNLESLRSVSMALSTLKYFVVAYPL
jgi:hypothetical protein